MWFYEGDTVRKWKMYKVRDSGMTRRNLECQEEDIDAMQWRIQVYGILQVHKGKIKIRQ